MFKNLIEPRYWQMRYFRGGYLATEYNLTKSEALTLMKQHIDGHSIECVKGVFKGKTIYRFPKNKE